jgi:hypothetical protein
MQEIGIECNVMETAGCESEAAVDRRASETTRAGRKSEQGCIEISP